MSSPPDHFRHRAQKRNGDGEAEGGAERTTENVQDGRRKTAGAFEKEFVFATNKTTEKTVGQPQN